MNGGDVSVEELAELEVHVTAALRRGNDGMLNVLGYGEVSVALGWPIEHPHSVCKRTPPFSRQEFAAYHDLVTEYIERLEASGLHVAETKIMTIETGDQVIAYLVQPMLAASTLGHNVLAASEPDADHPLLAAVAEVLDVVTPEISVDAQFTNFAWDGSTLTLVDVGTPFLWDGQGTFRFDIRPSAHMLPAPVRALAVRELTKLVSRWNDPRRVALDIVANLYREGLDNWIDPTVVALNRRLDVDTPISAGEAREMFEEDLKIWPFLKKLQAVERWWRNTVRRGTYQWFIKSTFES